MLSMFARIIFAQSNITYVHSTAGTTVTASATVNATLPSTPLPNLLPPPSSIPYIPNNRSFTITNSCPMDLWPAVLTTNNTGPYTGGFHLPPNKSLELWVSHDWTGRFWARTNCSFNETTNTGSCFTGSCGNVLDCSLSGEPPTSLAEFDMLGWQNLTYYDISLVNGFNLPLGIYPSQNAPAPICQWSPTTTGILNQCPEQLVYYADAPTTYTEVAGCMSACDHYGLDEFCCTGKDDSKSTCGPTKFSRPFKSICPDAYSYAYDDETSSFAAPNGPQWSYEIVFCPGIWIMWVMLILVGASSDYLHGSAGRLHRGGSIWIIVGLCTVLLWIGL